MGFIINAPESLLSPARVVISLAADEVMTDEQFFEFCQLNRDLRIERTVQGEIVIMKPAGGETGGRNASVSGWLWNWARQNEQGIAFDSSTGFILPNGATLSPDAAWVLRERLAVLTPEQKRRFLPLAPDFVVELRSPSDNVADLQEKLQQYLANGVRLAWLLVPETRTVYIGRPGQPLEELVDPTELSGETVLPGFVLPLAEIWNPGF